MKPTAQQCHTLTSHYVVRYKETFGTAPSVNRNKARWGFESVLMDLSMQDAKALIDYWLTTNAADKDLDWFMYNYDKLIETKSEDEDNSARRKQLMQESAKRSAAWKAAGNKTITEE